MAISSTDYAEYRPLLRTLAYRMLGSVSEAEDIVQDALADYYLQNRAASASREDSIARDGNAVPAETDSAAESPFAVKHEKAYLVRMVTNRCINLKQSARARREQYVGNWLPEPSVSYTDAHSSADPAEQFERQESVNYAMMVLMEQLSGVERAVFLLRETLGYDYAEIADIVQKSEANCRKLFSRAKEKLARQNAEESQAALEAENRGATRNGSEKLESRATQGVTALAESFIRALESGSLDQLVGLLAKDAVLTTDGGGKVNAAIFPIYGRDRVIAFYEGVIRKNPMFESYSLADVSGQPGIVLFSGGKPTYVVTFRLDEYGRMDRIYMIRNPEKLEHVPRSAETEGLKRS